MSACSLLQGLRNHINLRKNAHDCACTGKREASGVLRPPWVSFTASRTHFKIISNWYYFSFTPQDTLQVRGVVCIISLHFGGIQPF